MTVFALALSLGLISTTVGRRCRHAALLELRAAQDFEWRNMYYRRCRHWRWAKDGDAPLT